MRHSKQLSVIGNDRVWGIERYKRSDYNGVLVCPAIYLWKRPGGFLNKSNLSGALSHNTEVEILDSEMKGGRKFFLVRAQQGGKEQKGWVQSTMLLDRGAINYEEG